MGVVGHTESDAPAGSNVCLTIPYLGWWPCGNMRLHSIGWRARLRPD